MSVQKATLFAGSRTPKGLARPSVAWCFGMARPRFGRIEGRSVEASLSSVQKETLGTRSRRQDARASNGRKQEAKEQEASKQKAR